MRRALLVSLVLAWATPVAGAFAGDPVEDTQCYLSYAHSEPVRDPLDDDAAIHRTYDRAGDAGYNAVFGVFDVLEGATIGSGYVTTPWTLARSIAEATVGERYNATVGAGAEGPILADHLVYRGSDVAIVCYRVSDRHDAAADAAWWLVDTAAPLVGCAAGEALAAVFQDEASCQRAGPGAIVLP